MAPPKKRENRGNQFYNVGVEGRKTGITVPDRGVYDEHGLEALSGIFSSPEKSPPKRGGTITASESMEIQESSIPELTTSHQILRNNRTHLPPPRSRSPKKTALGSSPRRQSSIAPRVNHLTSSSPVRAVSHPAVARRLDFEQDDSSLQETPALSGSGQRRGKRADVYDIPENSSPMPMADESMVQEEITANEDSMGFDGAAEESFVAQIGEDTMTGAEDLEESEVAPEPVRPPAKRGRKRKSDVLDLTRDQVPSATKVRKRDATSSQSSNVAKKSQNPALAGPSRRSKRVSDMTEQEHSVLDTSIDAPIDLTEEAETIQVAPKKRGRPARPKPDADKENVSTAKASKPVSSKVKEKELPAFKKPPKPATKATNKAKTAVSPREAESQTNLTDLGKLVDVTGKPLSKKDIEQMSTTSIGSRYGRGRHLSVYRELVPEAVARIGRTGRHRVAPIDFWKNDRIAYGIDGSMTSVVKNEATEEPRKQHKSSGRPKGKKRSLTAMEEEELELEPWEEEGTLVGNYREFDAVTDVTTQDIIEDTIAWADNGIKPVDVPDGSFKYTKLASAGTFFNWGLIELRADQMKRTKNSRKMHMVFNVQSGTVEVKVHENEFTVHRSGIWQVPRGNTYSIRNVGTGTARIFFSQAAEVAVQPED